jgi:hypothetical protein
MFPSCRKRDRFRRVLPHLYPDSANSVSMASRQVASRMITLTSDCDRVRFSLDPKSNLEVRVCVCEEEGGGVLLSEVDRVSHCILFTLCLLEILLFCIRRASKGQDRQSGRTRDNGTYHSRLLSCASIECGFHRSLGLRSKPHSRTSNVNHPPILLIPFPFRSGFVCWVGRIHRQYRVCVCACVRVFSLTQRQTFSCPSLSLHVTIDLLRSLPRQSVLYSTVTTSAP